MDRKKKIAAIAAVTHYIKSEQEAAAFSMSQFSDPVPDTKEETPFVMNLWGISGRQQQMQRQAALHCPIDHHAVEVFERMPDIAQEYQAAQDLAPSEVFFELFLPLIFDAQGHLGEAVAGQVD